MLPLDGLTPAWRSKDTENELCEAAEDRINQRTDVRPQGTEDERDDYSEEGDHHASSAAWRHCFPFGPLASTVSGRQLRIPSR